MQSYLGMRRSYEPPAPSTAARAGVGLLFQTSGDGKIVVKEVVKGGSAARSGQIKSGDVIMRVGSTNVQGQTLVHLRELILGEPGTYVTLGFTRGGIASQFFEVSLLRGSPEFLDQHGGEIVKQSPTQSHGGGGMGVAAAAPYTSGGGGMGAPSSREVDEIERLRAALSASQAEVSRLRANLRSQELQVERNGEELRTYRDMLEKSQDQNRLGSANQDRRQQELIADFKRRYDRERQRLSATLEKSQTVARSVEKIIPTLQGMERELATSKLSPSKGGFGY